MNRSFLQTRCIAFAYFVQQTNIVVPLDCTSTNDLSSEVPWPCFRYFGSRAKREIYLIACPSGAYEVSTFINPICAVFEEIRCQSALFTSGLGDLLWANMPRPIHQKRWNPPVPFIKLSEKAPSSEPFIIRSKINGTSKREALTQTYSSPEVKHRVEAIDVALKNQRGRINS